MKRRYVSRLIMMNMDRIHSLLFRTIVLSLLKSIPSIALPVLKVPVSTASVGPVGDHNDQRHEAGDNTYEWAIVAGGLAKRLTYRFDVYDVAGFHDHISLSIPIDRAEIDEEYLVVAHNPDVIGFAVYIDTLGKGEYFGKFHVFVGERDDLPAGSAQHDNTLIKVPYHGEGAGVKGGEFFLQDFLQLPQRKSFGMYVADHR